MTPASSPWRILADEPGFRRLWTATAISELGSIVARLTFVLVVNQRAFRAGGAPESAAALVLIAETLAMIACGPFAGALVDRYDRRRLLVGANAAQAALAATVPFVAALDATWPLYVLAMAMSGVSTLFPPARQSSIPDLVGLERAPAANSISSSTTSFVYVVGAAFAALLIAQLDARACFAATTVAFLVSAVVVSRLALPRRARDEDEPAGMLRDVTEGFAHVRGSPKVAYVVLSYFVSFVFIGIWLPLMPEYLRRHAGLDPERWYPLAILAFGLGGILGGMIGPWIGRRVRVGRAVVLTFFLEPVVMAAYGLPWHGWPVLVCSFTWGALAYAYFVQEHTVLQQDVPPGLRGRVFGMLPPLQALGALIASGLVWFEAGRIHPGDVMLIAGAGYFVASAAFLALHAGGVALWRRPNLAEAD